MGAVKKRRYPLRNMSLRTSYVVYTLVAFAIMILLCSFILQMGENARMGLVNKYWGAAVTYTIPDGGSYDVRQEEDGAVYTIYDASGQMTDQFRVDYAQEECDVEYTILEGERRVAETFSVRPRMTEEDRRKDIAIGLLMSFSIPVCFGVGTILCAFYFFRRKLKEPIAILSDASERIAASDLDFTISYDSRDEMGKLCRSFETMRSALVENNREMFRQMEDRRGLTAAFSHDLRTPLTVLDGYVEMLRLALSEQNWNREEAEAAIETMASNLRRLESYTEAMAKLQRLEDVEIRPASVASGALIGRIQAAAHILCAGKTLEWNLPEEKTWHVDAEIVMEVCENILNNSSRFAHSRITVSISDAGGSLCILVSDDGNGFSSRVMDQAATPFYKGKDTAEDGHLGLGLSICSILCRRHGGELTLSNNGRGGALVCASFSMEKE